jgi:hypothetical protein
METPLHFNIEEIISLPNRFIFEEIADEQLQSWYYPVTDKIGTVKDF